MAQVTSLEDYLTSLQESGRDGTSAYNLRNENEQTKSRVASIARLKKEKKKKSKLLVVMELAIPFNPTTGKADDKYNPDRKFRPQMSATTVALMLKQEAAKNPDVKEAFLKKAGVDSWDVSDPTTFTKEDKTIFHKFRVPSVYTFPVVNVRIPVMTKDFGRDYLIKVTRDPMTNQIVGEKPLVIQANEFFRDIAYEEYRKFLEDCTSGKLNLTEKQQKERISKIFDTPVSDDHPINYLVAMELPLTTTYKLSETYDDLEVKTFKPNLVQFKRTKAMDDSIKKYLSEEWGKYDKHFDFVEIDMVCPAEGETPMDIGKDTTYEKPTETLDETKYDEIITNVFREYFDGEENMENVMINSVRIAKYDESIERQLCSALSSVVNPENEFITKAVIDRHKEFITIALGDVGSELLLELDMDDENRADGNLDAEEAAKIAKGVSLEHMLEEDDVADLVDMETID